MATFQQTTVFRRVSIILNFGFHHSIAHSLVSFGNQIHLCDVIRFSMTCKSVRGVGNQLLDTRTNYRMLYFFLVAINYRTAMKLCGIVSYRLDGSFRYFCRMQGILCQVNHVNLVHC